MNDDKLTQLEKLIEKFEPRNEILKTLLSNNEIRTSYKDVKNILNEYYVNLRKIIDILPCLNHIDNDDVNILNRARKISSTYWKFLNDQEYARAYLHALPVYKIQKLTKNLEHDLELIIDDDVIDTLQNDSLCAKDTTKSIDLLIEYLNSIKESYQ